MHHDVPLWIIAGIVAGYSLFVCQLFYFSPPGSWNKPESRAVLTLAIVFVFCALSGYASTLFPSELAGIRTPLHLVLLAATGWLVSTSQARLIARLMSRAKDND